MPASCGVIVLCTFVVCFEAVSGCDIGFMQLDLLKKRAEKISSGNTVSGNKLDRELRVVPGLRFTCSGNIISLLLGGDVRILVDNRVEYPEVQIWRQRSSRFIGVHYTKEYGQTIELSSGNFSSDGLLQYNLTTPIPFENEDVLGVYHPLQNDSIVRLFYVDDPNAPVSEFVDTFNIGTIIPGITPDLSNHHMLIYPVTDPPGCTSDDFLTPEALRQKTLEVNINRVVVRDRQQRMFPDISFTCNGSITKWIVGAGTGGGSSPSSEIQIWRRSGANSYTKVASAQLTAQSPINNSNVYEYVPSSPLGFQEGDILGVYQREDSSVVPYYQESTGPVNLRQSGRHDFALNCLTTTQATEYDYPLVTVEIGPPLTNAMLTIEESCVTTKPVTEDEGPTKTSGSITRMPVIASRTAVSSHTILSNSSTLPIPAAPVNNAAIIAAAVVVLAVAGIAIVAVILIIVVIIQKKKSKAHLSEPKPLSSDIQMTAVNNNLDNPMYSDSAFSGPSIELYHETPNIYEKPDAALDASAYEQPVSSLRETYEWGVVVPTMTQRRATNSSENYYAYDNEIYSQLVLENSQLYNASNSSFFEETVVYWEPGSDCVTIYEQLAQKRFREIIRDQVEITEHLGSGQFGWVNKGVWHSPKKSIDVAVKMLKEHASEEEMVKFLQEAAIMGQFHHPNIVKLHGVVTMGEPTMIVLELVKHGDLSGYLHTLRPIPGEMAPPSLPQQLLGYCRQIASGMEYLSKKSFVHRDLAARNILVDDERTCKIADFGMSRNLSDSDYYVSEGGRIPVKWTAPEALNYKKYSTASDVWSFGVLMYEIWSLGHKPFEGKTNHQAAELITTGYRLAPPPGCPKMLYAIMIECWHPETSGRPSFASLVSRLSQPENQLLKWTDRDKRVTHPQSTMLGAPLETASDLYSDVQQQYSR